MKNTQRTDIDMVTSGTWAKTGDKTYRHESGVTVSYDHNSFGWKIEGVRGIWKTLRAVRFMVESGRAA
jgi:hypothetical protein